MPKWYGERMRRKVQAGAGCEDLRRRCPYFYDVAMRLHSLGAPPAVGEFTNATFRARYRASCIGNRDCRMQKAVSKKCWRRISQLLLAWWTCRIL